MNYNQYYVPPANYMPPQTNQPFYQSPMMSPRPETTGMIHQQQMDQTPPPMMNQNAPMSPTPANQFPQMNQPQMNPYSQTPYQYINQNTPSMNYEATQNLTPRFQYNQQMVQGSPNVSPQMQYNQPNQNQYNQPMASLNQNVAPQSQFNQMGQTQNVVPQVQYGQQMGQPNQNLATQNQYNQQMGQMNQMQEPMQVQQSPYMSQPQQPPAASPGVYQNNSAAYGAHIASQGDFNMNQQESYNTPQIANTENYSTTLQQPQPQPPQGGEPQKEQNTQEKEEVQNEITTFKPTNVVGQYKCSDFPTLFTGSFRQSGAPVQRKAFTMRDNTVRPSTEPSGGTHDRKTNIALNKYGKRWELRGGKYYGCFTSRTNGLQDNCPKVRCKLCPHDTKKK